MVVLDTSVLSAIMGSQPVEVVASWVAAHPEELLFTVRVCKADILAGIAVLPSGRRRQRLQAAAEAIFGEDFGGGCYRSMAKPRACTPNCSPAGTGRVGQLPRLI